MSDLLSGPQPSGSAGIGRAQNGGSRAAQGPVPVATDQPRGVRTPTDVMRARRDREARKRAAEQEAARQQLEENRTGRQQDEQNLGVSDGSPMERRPAARRTGFETQVQTQDDGRRQATGQTSGVSGRRQENVAPGGATAQPAARPRVTTLDQGQPRPVLTQPQPRVASGSRYQAPQIEDDPVANLPEDPLRRRPEGSSAPQPAKAALQQDSGQSTSQQPGVSERQPQRPSFPHAFERWETLSAHWEGQTSYWVRRLQENSNELNDKPLNQQMARQIADLSAAGANLFHAVVELQRLRASSERKFQRWFFETRAEQERAQEIQADLERQLRAERETNTGALTAALASAQVEKQKAEELVREMRRELQISKEEARRAWEELGRREQDERERTISLRSGEPTLVGGVQVVPMAGGFPSRQTSAANRPQTREGPYPGGPGPSSMGGQGVSRSHTTTTLESPEEEQRQFTHEPSASSDPFPRGSPRHQLHHEADVEFRHVSQRPAQPASSSAAMASLQTSRQQQSTTSSVSSPARNYVQPTTSAAPGTGNGRFYQQSNPNTAILHPPASTSASQGQSQIQQPTPYASSQTQRPGTTGSDQQSYIPSTASPSNGSDLGEEEYEINPDGTYSRDVQGRRIPYRQAGRRLGITSDEGSDEYDVASEVERERLLRERYGTSSGSAQQTIADSRAGALASIYSQVTSLPSPSQEQQRRQQQQEQQQSLPSQQQGSLISPLTSPQMPPPPTQQPSAASASSPDYSGASYGGEVGGDGAHEEWSAVTGATGPRHRHQTRLSDIVEERSGRTTPSRASYVSEGGEQARSMGTSTTMGGGAGGPSGSGVYGRR